MHLKGFWTWCSFILNFCNNFKLIILERNAKGLVNDKEPSLYHIYIVRISRALGLFETGKAWYYQVLKSHSHFQGWVIFLFVSSAEPKELEHVHGFSHSCWRLFIGGQSAVMALVEAPSHLDKGVAGLTVQVLKSHHLDLKPGTIIY